MRIISDKLGIFLFLGVLGDQIPKFYVEEGTSLSLRTF